MSAAGGGLKPEIDLDNSGALQEMDDLDIRPPARMILPDVDVLIYAFRKDSPRHRDSKPWLDSVVRGDAQFGLSPLTLSAVARIVTNPRVFEEPSPIAEAFAFCDNLLGQPHCQVVVPARATGRSLRGFVSSWAFAGLELSDAWFAALAIEHGCTWITYDRDYARFPELDWRTPAP